jgi:hypothetical protein
VSSSCCRSSRIETDGCSDARDSKCELPLNQLSFQSQDAVAETVEHAIAARIGSLLASMMAPIHFDDESHRGSDEVSDVPPERNLATEPHPKPAAPDLRPELLLGRREIRAHLTSAKLDEFLSMRLRE